MTAGTYANLRELLEQQVERYQERPFLFVESDGRVFTYREFDREVNHLAARLTALGTRKGDRVSLYLTNSAEYFIAYFACFKLGGNGFGWLQGTSMATPNALGVAALVVSAKPQLRGNPAALTSRTAGPDALAVEIHAKRSRPRQRAFRSGHAPLQAHHRKNRPPDRIARA